MFRVLFCSACLLSSAAFAGYGVLLRSASVDVSQPAVSVPVATVRNDAMLSFTITQVCNLARDEWLASGGKAEKYVASMTRGGCKPKLPRKK